MSVSGRLAGLVAKTLHVTDDPFAHTWPGKVLHQQGREKGEALSQGFGGLNQAVGAMSDFKTVQSLGQCIEPICDSVLV